MDRSGRPNRYTTEIVVNELLMLGQKPEAARAETGPAVPRAPVRSGLTPPPREPATAGDAGDDFDDIPF